MSRGEPEPEADIICWSANIFSVRCPYCGKIHRHGLFSVRCPYCEEIHRHGFDSYADGTRVSHCAVRGSYRYSFPIDQSTGYVAYEIDKPNARFVNVCCLDDLRDVSDDNVEEDDGNQLADEFRSKATISTGSADERQSRPKICEAAQETVTVKLNEDETFEQERVTFVISDCVLGEVAKVRKYLEDSKDSWVFLHGDIGGGDTTLIMASMEKSSDMVCLLLDHGADPNATNNKGRTALMEAALWGRLDNVKELMSRGADTALKDAKRRAAVDLAQPTRKHQRERYERAGGQLGFDGHEPVYKEDTFIRDGDRREIVRLLGGDNGSRPKTVYGSLRRLLDYEDSSFRRSPNDLSVVFRESVEKYTMPRERKSTARLERGEPFPTVSAMSGWGHHQCTDWTSKVFAISRAIGHTLSSDDFRDHGVQGRFQASHAEKQLIAYFIERHVFLGEDRIPCQELDNRVETIKSRTDEICSADAAKQICGLERKKRELELDLLSADDSLSGDKNDEMKARRLELHIQDVNDQISNLEKFSEVKELRDLQLQLQRDKQKQATHNKLIEMSENRPPVSLTKAVILVSSPSRQLCDDCELFKDRVNEVFGLSIKMRECTEA